MNTDFLCKCGHFFNTDVKTHGEFDEDADVFTLTYTITCPKCGRAMQCRDVYTRTSETEIGEIGD